MLFIPDTATVALGAREAQVLIPEFVVAYDADLHARWKTARCLIGKRHSGRECEKEGDFATKDAFLLRLASNDKKDLVLGRPLSVYSSVDTQNRPVVDT